MNVTANSALSPGWSVSVLGSTVTVRPSSPVTCAVYVLAAAPTLVTDLRHRLPRAVDPADGDRCEVEVARVERVAGRLQVIARLLLDAVRRAAEERHPVVEVAVVDQARVDGRVGGDVARALSVERRRGRSGRRRGRRVPVVISADLIIIGDQSGCRSA